MAIQPHKIAIRLLSLCTLVWLSIAINIDTFAEPLSPEVYREMRREARERKRQLVFHSDGVAMHPDKQYHESNRCVFPDLPGTQTSACTYSLIHQFPVARLYRTRVGIEDPPGIITKLYGEGPDGLDEYITFCRRNNYEAFWAMRTNDTHDAGNDEHGKRRLQSNKWKLEHPDLLVGDPNRLPPFAGWTAYDYAEPEVRDKVYQVLEEVCQNYEIDGIVLDFFRHLPTFKSTAWGGKSTVEEQAMLTSLLRRVRSMLDRIGMERQRTILLAVRTPDGLDYCRAQGFDVEQWMKEGLLDIWIATGYFQLQSWEETVRIGHEHDVQVWASLDESRVVGRENRNSLEAYRARIMNAWRAGVDAVWMFNFFYYPDDPQFQLLFEAGDISTLACTNKMYVADPRGDYFTKLFLKDGETFLHRPVSFSPRSPESLAQGMSTIVSVAVGDDLESAVKRGFSPNVTLRIQSPTSGAVEQLDVAINGKTLEGDGREDGWIDYKVNSNTVALGDNQFTISCIQGQHSEITLNDLQLVIEYENKER